MLPWPRAPGPAPAPTPAVGSGVSEQWAGNRGPKGSGQCARYRGASGQWVLYTAPKRRARPSVAARGWEPWCRQRCRCMHVALLSPPGLHSGCHAACSTSTPAAAWPSTSKAACWHHAVQGRDSKQRQCLRSPAAASTTMSKAARPSNASTVLCGPAAPDVCTGAGAASAAAVAVTPGGVAATSASATAAAAGGAFCTSVCPQAAGPRPA